MLNVFKSNRVEYLIEELVRVVDQDRAGAMQPDWIGIQSKGMKQWITLHLARSYGICANTRFIFPRQMIEFILNGFGPLSGLYDLDVQGDYVSKDTLFWPVFQKLADPEKGALTAISPYLEDDASGKKRFQLAHRITTLFEDYQIYRPQMLLEWQQNNNGLNDPAARWQCELWNGLNLKTTDLIFGQIRLFLEQFDTSRIVQGYYPNQMSLFGISALPQYFLEVLNTVSGIMDINLFLMVPSNQYFFDIRSESDLSKLALTSDSDLDMNLMYYETGHPLLASIGKSVQSFCRLLEQYDYLEPGPDLFVDPSDGNKLNMLQQIQADMFNLTHRKSGEDELPIQVNSEDRSIQIHACHSAMREAQVLKDLLWDAFEKDPELHPDDIIVMMPDIEAYAPFIESVFSVEHGLPIAVSDRRKRSESDLLKSFLKILSLSDGRYERNRVMDLLLSESIATKFGIGPEDMPKIEHLVRESNILWGQSGQHRKELDLPEFDENTWEFGLNRLFLGMAMPENSMDLVQGVLPCDAIEGLELELLGKLADFCRALFDQLAGLKKKRDISLWCQRFRHLTNALLSRDRWHAEDFEFLQQVFEEIEVQASEAGFSEPVSFDVFRALVEQRLDMSIAQGSFMAGRITFCNIMPMRGIPFKMVVLMGMDEASFPRQSFKPGFDLIKKYPEPGDRNQRDEDRYLFLEALLSARSRLIVTYTGMNIQDNSLIPCAGVVSELLEVLQQSFVFSDGFELEHQHPLHPFDPLYFLPSKNRDRLSDFRSFSEDNLNIATALAHGKQPTSNFIEGSFPSDQMETLDDILLDDLIGFFRHPLKFWVQNRLNLKLPELEDPEPEREGFTVQGLDQYQVGTKLLDIRYQDRNADGYSLFNASGSLPLGQKGRMEFDRISNQVDPLIRAAEPYYGHPVLEPLSGRVNCGGRLVSGTLSDIRKDGLITFTYGRVNGFRLIHAWIRHLFLNEMSQKGYPKTSVVIGRDPGTYKPRPVVQYRFAPVGEKASFYLEQLTDIFIHGQTEPVYFFCETGWQFFKALKKAQLDISESSLVKVMNHSTVRTCWNGSPYMPGEKEDRYTRLCIETKDPFESVQTLQDSGFVQIVQTVYQPLFDHLQDVS